MHLIWRVLTFRATREELLVVEPRHLYLGLLWTWLAGMGRYWDNPKAVWAQQLGLGSLIYVFVLAGIIWIVVAPVSLKPFSYRNLLTYITVTAPPAVLYAIPVERFLSLEMAIETNVWFLAAVAAWRLALYWRYLKLVPDAPPLGKITAGVLPVAAIVFVLGLLNLEHAVFAIMGGIPERTAYDGSFAVVSLLAILSFLSTPFLLLFWAAAIAQARRRREENGRFSIVGD